MGGGDLVPEEVGQAGIVEAGGMEAVGNFTDANNWTFSVTRDTSVNTQNC